MKNSQLEFDLLMAAKASGHTDGDGPADVVPLDVAIDEDDKKEVKENG